MKYIRICLILFTISASSCKKEYTCACYNPYLMTAAPPAEVFTPVKGKNRDAAVRSCAQLDTAQGPTVTCYLK